MKTWETSLDELIKIFRTALVALLRVTPGIYTLPEGGGNDVGLPFCLRMGEDAQPIGAEVGQATQAGIESFYYRLEQPMTTVEGFLFHAVFSQKFAEGEPFNIVLNGLEAISTYKTSSNAGQLALIKPRAMRED